MLQLLNASAEQAISVGDTGDDIIASKRALVRAIGATWSAADADMLSAAKPEFSVATVSALRSLLLDLSPIDSQDEGAPM